MLLLVAPGAVVFICLMIVRPPRSPLFRSGSLFRSTSATATEWGGLPVAKVCWVAKEGVVAPGAVVFNSTDTVLSVALATTRSGLPSPLTSATATATGAMPVAKAGWGAKEAGGAPAAAVRVRTDREVRP